MWLANFLREVLGTDEQGLKTVLLVLLMSLTCLDFVGALAACLVPQKVRVGGCEIENPSYARAYIGLTWVFAITMTYAILIVLPVLWALGPRR